MAVAATLRPNGQVSQVYANSASDSTNYDKLDESTLDTSDYIYKYTAGSPTPATYDCGTETHYLTSYTKGGTISQVKAYFNVGYTTGTYGHGYGTFTIKIFKGSTELASAVSTSTGWITVTYTGNLTQSEVDDLRLQFGCVATNDWYSDGKTTQYFGIYVYDYMEYVEITEAGWGNISKLYGATATDLAKWNGTSLADLAKFNGASV
jgi:hypothetical protein